MAFIEKRNSTYMADTKEDLKLIQDQMGAKCYVIKEGATYTLMSNGEWVKKSVNSNNSKIENSVDLSKYATTEYVDERFENIEHPEADLEEITSNPVFKMFDPSLNPAGGASYGIYLNASNPTTLAEAMKAKGIGLVNIWLQKGRADLPQTMISANTSGRGFACVDFQNAEDANDFIGYAVIFDKLNNMFFQFISHGTVGPWMKVSTTEG